MIDKNISIANLIAMLKEIMESLYGSNVKVRIRPGYFPFTEPGIEVDMSCTICGCVGCPACKHTGWLEMGGAGMVHPNVLRAGGIDPEIYSGWAFGVGTLRLVMMKYGINDIRYFNGGDLRFINQF
jgi:phenylalanyl-tRNA synthetase alpha chain